MEDAYRCFELPISSSSHKSNLNNSSKQKNKTTNLSTFNMKLSNIVATAFFATTTLSAGVLAEKPTNLRRHLEDAPVAQARRGLFGSITFGQIATAFEPIFAAAMEASLSAGADPLRIDATLTQALDSVVFSADCTSSASVTFTVGELDGLGGFVMDNMPVVDGSQETSFSFFNGITWAADFLVEGSFPEGLELPVDATITADACGTPIEQSIAGLVDAVGAGLRLTTSAEGSGPSITTLSSSSASASVSADAFDLGQLSTDMEFGNGIELDLAQIIGEVLNAPAFVDQIATLIAEFLDNALGGLTLNF